MGSSLSSLISEEYDDYTSSDYVEKVEVKDNKKKADLEKCKVLNEYILQNRGTWWFDDLLKADTVPTTKEHSNWKHHAEFDKQVDRGDEQVLDYQVFSRATKINPQTVFYYWNSNPVNMGIDDAVLFFTRMLKSTHNWTSIFKSADLLLANPKERFYVWHMVYEATKPLFGKSLIEPRHLIGIFAIKTLKEEEYPSFLQNEKNCKVVLISLRSVPHELVPIKIPSAEPQILWIGTYLLIGKGSVTHVHKWDSENEGGFLLQPLTDIAFPDFVQKEAIGTTEYIRKEMPFIRTFIDHLPENSLNV